MLSKADLLRAIDELEDAAPTFENCQKMATFYTLLNALYRSREETPKQEPTREELIGYHGDSEFLETLEGFPANEAWAIMDELMEAVQVLQPKLYASVLRRLRGEA